MLNRVRDLLQNKANKPSRRARQPLEREGVEGDFVLTRLKDGIFVFFKGMGKWLKIFHSRTSLIPDKTKAYDLGSHTRRWKNLYLSNNAINIGDTKDLSIKLSTDGTDLIFNDKDDNSEKVVGKIANADIGSSLENAVTIGEDNTSNGVGILSLGSGDSHYGGYILGATNPAEALTAGYLGLRILSGSPNDNTSIKDISGVRSGANTIPTWYIGKHAGTASDDEQYGGHIALHEANVPPTAVDDYGLLFGDEDDHKLYYRHNELSGGSVVDLTDAGGGGGGGNLTTKGDLEVYTSSQTRLGVGTNDHVLTANSSASAGVEWKRSTVTSGDTAPSSTDINDKTPNVGDMYIHYSDSVGDGEPNDTGEFPGVNNQPHIYIRDSDALLMKYQATNTGYMYVKEFIDTGLSYNEPACTGVFFTTSAGTTAYGTTTLLVGSQLTVYGYATYTEVDQLPFTNEAGSTVSPRLSFSGQIDLGGVSGHSPLDVSTGNTKQHTTTAKTVGYLGTDGSCLNDSSVDIDWYSASVSAADGQGSSVEVLNSAATKSIHFKNHRIYGLRRNNDSWEAVISHGTASGGSFKYATLVHNGQHYKTFNSFTVTAQEGDEPFVAIPEDASSPGYWYIEDGTTNQFSALNTATATYTNSQGFAQTYKIFYQDPIGGNGDVEYTVY